MGGMVRSLELAEVGPQLVLLAVVARRLGLLPQEVRLVLAALDVLIADAVILQGTPTQGLGFRVFTTHVAILNAVRHAACCR